MRDLGSRASGVGVRVPMPAPRRSKLYIACSDFFTKSQSALIPLLLLSKSNPLRWVSIWVQRAFSINTRHLDNVPFSKKPCAASFLSRTERFFVSTGKPARLLSGCFFACSAAPPKNKKCVSPKPSGLTHFCYTIFPSNFLPFFHISPDSMKKRMAILQLVLRRIATRCRPIIADSPENFKWFYSPILHAVPRSILEYNSSALLTN